MRAAVLFLIAWAIIGAAPAAADNRCTRLLRTTGGDVVVNTCETCREVSVVRRRPTGGAPSQRTYIVSAESRFPLPFRGPGHTRITSERACPGAAPPPAGNQRTEASACVQFRRTQDGRTVLINPCQECRTVQVERRDTAGNRAQSTVAVGPQAMVPFRAGGAAEAEIVAEKPCG